jgi:hypothetical protein
MTATTFAVGTAPLEDFDLTGRPDLVPSRVEVKFIERTADGRPEYKTQADGTAATGRVQVIGLSGKELDTFLPPDDYESYDAQTVSANQTISNLQPSILSMLPQVTDSRNQFAGDPRNAEVTLANGETLKWFEAVGSRQTWAGVTLFTEPKLQFIDAENGTPVSPIGKNLVVSQTAPEWAADVFTGGQKIRIKGRIYRLELNKKYDFTGTQLVTTNVMAEPKWSQAFPWSASFFAAHYTTNEPIGLNNPDLAYSVYHNHFDFEIDAVFTTATYATPTTFYKPQDYEYLSPPANLASNLRSAQNFTPFEGSIRLVYSALPALTNELQYKFNITGAQSSLTAAGALPRAVNYDLAGQSVDIEIGAPSRFNFSTLGGKVRQTPQTNITIN